jgi:hypothetical protein
MTNRARRWLPQWRLIAGTAVLFSQAILYPADSKPGTELSPTSGWREKPDPEWSRRALLALERDQNWDLTPPRKEPKYQNQPRYSLLVFGAKRQTRVWLVLDGNVLYVDRNGNGDLTEPEKRILVAKPKDDDPKLGNPGMYTHFEVHEFTVQTANGAACPFRFWHLIRAQKFTPQTDFEKRRYASWLTWRYERGYLWRLEGQAEAMTLLHMMPKPADAQVVAFDSELTFAVKAPEYQVLERGQAGCELSFHIIVPAHGPRGAEFPFLTRLATKEVRSAAYLEADIDYPAKSHSSAHIHRKYLLKERC